MSLRTKLRRLANRGLWVRPGHYYSPIPSQRDITRALQQRDREPVGVDVRAGAQLALVDRLGPLMAELPRGREDGWRWHDGPANRMFGRADAQLYYAMLADRRPSRVVEVGSGFSSAVALDAADRHSPDTRFAFVEPYPDRLLGLLRPGDSERTTLLRLPVQDVDMVTFTDLRAGDFLFIDSTHVAKAGSDVLFLFLEVLPRLASGVIVQVHDVHWPFTYPRRWLEEGRAWNEAYLLQALLLAPSRLRILAWGSWLAQHGRPGFADGGSIWLEVM